MESRPYPAELLKRRRGGQIEMREKDVINHGPDRGKNRGSAGRHSPRGYAGCFLKTGRAASPG